MYCQIEYLTIQLTASPVTCLYQTRHAGHSPCPRQNTKRTPTVTTTPWQFKTRGKRKIFTRTHKKYITTQYYVYILTLFIEIMSILNHKIRYLRRFSTHSFWCEIFPIMKRMFRIVAFYGRKFCSPSRVGVWKWPRS